MYNMNSSGGLLPMPVQGDTSGTTPRTPEILNSLIAMTNPFDAMRVGPGPRQAASPPSDSTSTSGSSVCSTSSPPSVQHTCSQLIKEGLKLTIQTKRKNNMSPALTDEPTAKPHHRSEEHLTAEDEERRRRRRERNKIAATKCRLKKRERTVNLVQESEILETQNHDLKSQIQELETERRQLIDMLSVHGRSCSKMPYTSVVSPAPYQECYTQQCNSSSSVETSPANYSAGYQSPYCKMEVSCESTYHKSTTSSNGSAEVTSYQRLETMEEMNPGGGGYSARPMLTYHNFDQGGVVVKESSALMANYCNRNGVDEGNSYMRTESSSAYTTTVVEAYSRSPRQYARPATLGLRPDYETGKNVLDSPSIAPTNYHHFDEDADNYSAGFPSGSCIS